MYQYIVKLPHIKRENEVEDSNSNRNRLVVVDSSYLLSVDDVKDRLLSLVHVPLEKDEYTLKGRTSQRCLPEGECGVVYLEMMLAVVGGKGGFGSLLRGNSTKVGQKKTTNFDACRDLNGRRLRHVNNEKRLKEWYESEEARKAALEQFKQTVNGKKEKVEFNHEQFVHDDEEVAKRSQDAVMAGLKQKQKLKQQQQALDEENEDEDEENEEEEEEDNITATTTTTTTTTTSTTATARSTTTTTTSSVNTTATKTASVKPMALWVPDFEDDDAEEEDDEEDEELQEELKRLAAAKNNNNNNRNVKRQKV